MLLTVVAVVVLVLLVVALLPNRKRSGETPTSPAFFSPLAASGNVREQQVREEADAIAAEYRHRAEEAWLEEVNEKAASLLKSPNKNFRR